MPELPEVETVCRQLDDNVAGRVVRSVEVRFAGRLNVPAADFSRRLTGRRLRGVRRRAKLIIFDFSGGLSLVAHLKMTGRFLLVSAEAVPTKHVHVVFRLSGRQQLFFEDTRKFGYLHLHATADLPQLMLREGVYGPEPLDPSFTSAKLAACLLRRPNQRIKAALLDQGCVAGIGNIYADETLWRAGVRPERRVNSLSPVEIRRLHRGAVSSLRQGVRYGGTSADDFLDVFGRAGRNAPRLKAYGRTGEPCANCGQPIRKMRLVGRGTHYCPRCQK